jgi:hypothetical protein
MNLYKIANEYLSVLDNIVNEETGEVDGSALERLNEVKESAEQKSIALASYIKNIEAERKAIEGAKKEMAEREKSLQNKVEYLTDYLKENMERLSITEIKCPHFQIKLKKCPVSVDVYDEDALPEEYKKTKTVISLDKNKIREEILAGVIINGAQLKQNNRVEIR